MKRVLNVVLILAVVAAGASIWLGRGHRLPWQKETAPVVTSPLPTLENPVHLVILNGTNVKGLANTFSLAMPSIGCVPVRVGNAPRKDYEKTLLVNRRLSADLAGAISQRLGGIEITREVDESTTEDAVLIIGADHKAVLGRLDAPVREEGR